MVLGAYRQILRNQALKLSNIQTHIAELQAYQSAFFLDHESMSGILHLKSMWMDSNT